MLGIMYVIRSKLRIGLTMKFLVLRHSNVKRSMIHYLQKSRPVQSAYYRLLINVLLMNQAYVQRELPNLYHAVNPVALARNLELGSKPNKKIRKNSYSRTAGIDYRLTCLSMGIWNVGDSDKWKYNSNYDRTQ
jgi:hypothetical protein